ncbi:MAG: DNA topoisomerase VI subunit B [Nanoarchaeota archaeon]|nr:DNA topoisomerase VI subunit B [Nanoarchaeota archaeon]
MGENRFRVIVEDNGPGIVKKQVPKIFAKLLYGSKFHRLKMSRGQQGIGISASVMYGQLTTGKPARITTKIGPKYPAYYCEVHINTTENKPEILKESDVEWNKEHGTRVEIDLEAMYQKGSQSIDAYLKQTAIVNPHCTIIYTNPKAEQIIFPRATDQLPAEPKEIKPHPKGVELGILIKMLNDTESRTMQSFLTTDFSRVGAGSAKEILQKAGILPNFKPENINRDQAERVIKAIDNTKLMNPPTDCVTPIGAEQLERGLKKEIKAEFYAATTRPPAVYRGNPFIVECCTGDTKVTLENGEIMTIKNFVESDLVNKKVFSMDKDLKIVASRTVAVHKIKNTHNILKIKTRTGKDLKITSNNELPIIENGEVVWKIADDCLIGDFIATPRQIKTFGEVPRIIDLLEHSHTQVVETKVILDVMDKLRNKFGSYKNAAKRLGIDYDRFKAYKRKGNATRFNLETLEMMCSEIGEDFDSIKGKIRKIRYVDTDFKNPNTISLPDLDEDLLYVAGLVSSDGHISQYAVSFINLDKNLHRLFKEKVERLFDLKASHYKNSTYVNSKALSIIFKAVMKNLTRLHDTLISAWLKGFVDGDGWIQTTNNNFLKTVGIATAKKDKAELVQSLLLRFGIISKIEKQGVPSKFGKIGDRMIITKEPKYNVVIASYENAQKFYSLISFRQKKRFETLTECMKNEIKPSNRCDVIPVGAALVNLREENNLTQYQLGFSDQSIRQIEKNRQNPTRNNLQQILLTQALVGSALETLKKLAFSDIFWDQIVSIDLAQNEEFVYDLTVENGNFIANNIVMHNCGIAYGGEQESDKQIRVLRYANRVPLQYQQSACAITQSLIQTNFRSYGLSQSKGALPIGPCTIVIHLGSVWVPFTSESKEAIAHYPEIIKEVKLAIQECGRQLASYVLKKQRLHNELKKRSHIEKYIPHIGAALKDLLQLSPAQMQGVETDLKSLLEERRGKIASIEAKNEEYDEELANIGGNAEEDLYSDDEQEGGEDNE